VDFDYSYLKAGVAEIAAAAAALDTPRIVAIISTVLPGTVDREIRPLLNDHVKLCYNPFFIAMGTCIADFLNPEFILLGVDDPGAAVAVRDFYATITTAPVRHMSIASAECVKVFYNTMITSKICFVNAMMEMCHHVRGANVDDVTRSLQAADRRIVSTAYMTAGMGDGGGCHPRDNIALSCRAHEYGMAYDPWGDMMHWREKQAEFLADLMMEHALPKVILGYTFKPETNLTVGSPALLVKALLEEKGATVHLYDPDVNGDPLPKHAAVYLIGCKKPAFSDWKFPVGSVVFDPHRYIIDQDGIQVIRVGE
jgi:UDPglucose 6-dehydrogenase